MGAASLNKISRSSYALKMEQQTLGSNYPNVPSIHEILLAEKRNRPPLLRRSSRSDSNLDKQNLVHLVASALEARNNGAPVMTLESAKSTPAAMPNLSTNPSQQSEVLGRNFSAFNLGLLGSEDRTNSIRKAASFIHGTSFGICRKPSTSSLLHLTPSFHIGGGILPPAVNPLTHEDHSAGLSFNIDNPNFLTVKQNTDIQHSASMGGGLFSNGNNETNSNRVPGGMVPNNSSDSLNSTNHKTGVMGMFGRGFFAKPLRSEEENYRVIMALDR